MCNQDCEDAPCNYTYRTGMFKPGEPPETHTAPHFHHTCWLCGEDRIGRSRDTYECDPCGYKQGPPCYPPTEKGYDGPDMAAMFSSPA